MHTKRLIGALCLCMSIAHALSITVNNATKDTVQLRGMPFREFCLHPFNHPLKPGHQRTTECTTSPEFYGAIILYPPAIYPQYITLALPGLHSSSIYHSKVIGCTLTPYLCHAKMDGETLTFDLSDRQGNSAESAGSSPWRLRTLSTPQP